MADEKAADRFAVPHRPAATALAEKLTQTHHVRAFRGELVPTEAELARADGREYEPAWALLGRIKRGRAASNINGSLHHTGARRCPATGMDRLLSAD